MSQATPFDLILTQCRDLFSERMSAAMAGMLDESDNALVALSNETRDPTSQKLYRELRDKLLTQRATIESQFKMLYLREFQQRSNRAKKIGDEFDDIDLSEIELALVGEDDLNETLKFNAMTVRLRRYCEEELVALDQRVGVLFGDAELQSEDNPFAPEAISGAYKQACAQVDTNVDARLTMLRLFDEYVLDEIRGIYRALNALLVQNSILPKLRGVSVTRKKDPEKPVRPKEGEQDLFALLQNMVAAKPAQTTQSATGAIGTPVPTGKDGAPGATVAGGFPQVLQAADLLRTLTRVQHGDAGAITGGSLPQGAVVTAAGTANVLHELKTTDLGSSMSRMDAMTLDIIALLFDQLFDDSRIPISVKGLIGRLQIPMLKVAIADKEFFSRKSHPARQMLDTLGEVAARLPEDVGTDNPTFVKMEEILQGLLASFEDNVEIFDTVGELLEALITDEDQRIEEQAQVAEQQIEQQETLALAKTVAQTQIKLRTRSGQLPESVIEFLFRQWIKVLLLIQVKEGERSETWNKALETMDLLIWSIEPKNTREERREMVGKVPDLLKRLTDALTYAGIEDEVRSRLFVDLRRLHSEILAGSGGAGVAASEGVSPSPDPTAQDDMPVAESTQAEAATLAVDTPEESPAQSPDESIAAPEALEFEVASEAAPVAPIPAAEAVPDKPDQVPAPAADDAALPFDMTETDIAEKDIAEKDIAGKDMAGKDMAGKDMAEKEASPTRGSADAPLAFELPDIETSTAAAPAQTPIPDLEFPSAATKPAPEAPSKDLPPLEFSNLETAPAPTVEPPESMSVPTAPMVENSPTPVPDKPAPAAKPSLPSLDISKMDSAPAPATDKSASAVEAPAPRQSKPSLDSPKIDTAASTPAAQDKAPLSFELPVLEPKPATGTAPGKPAPVTSAPVKAPTTSGTPVRAAPGAAAPVKSAPVKAPTVTAASVKAAVPTAASVTTPPVKPAPTKAAPARAAAVDLTAPVTVNNPFGEGEIEVDDLDFTVQLGGGTKGGKPAAGLPGNLSLGTWVEIRQKEDKGARRVAKLNFVSPLKTRFLFVDRHGKTVLECSQAALVRLMGDGDVKVTKEPTADAPLFDRLAEGVVSKLAERR